jgi:hypoxanthine-guanine phosphoribosyltransferase
MSAAASEPRQRRRADRRTPPDIIDCQYQVCDPAPPLIQETLPPLKWLLQPDDHRFAHPAEVELARLLTFYNIRWAYEPTTFAVRWRDDGSPEEFVTPDFFLPDHELYLELTTMRQRLVTRKNRKFRLLRENYPNVRVRILYQRDFVRLQNSYAPTVREQSVHMGSTLYQERELLARISELARELVDAWLMRPATGRDERPLLLGLGAGAQRFLDALGAAIHAQGFPVDRDVIEVTSMGAIAGAGQARIRVAHSPRASVAGRPVIVVQEVLSSGLSAAFIEGWLRRHGACDVDFCVLLDRQAARILDVTVGHRGFVAPDVSVAGYGLTRWREYSDLPYIAAIEPEPDEELIARR